MTLLDKDDNLFQECIDKWGMDFQVNLAIEEIGEVIEQLGKTLRKINKVYRGSINRDEMMEEFVDVYLMMQQMRYIDKEKFDFIYDYKVKRIKERLDK